MGDVLHGLPAVAALRARLSECRIGWAIEPRWSSLLATPHGEMPLVDRVHLVPTKEWKRRPLHPQTLAGIAAVRRELKAQRYDVCVDLQGSIRSAAIGKMAGARRFFGPARPREGPARLLYGECVEVRAAHVIGQACELLGAGVGLTLKPAAVRLPSSGRSALERIGVAPGERFALLVPAAGWGAKQWPVERYAELALKLREKDIRVLVNALSGNDALARAVWGELLVCTVAELADVIREAAVVVGGDTGPVQLAGALGTPVVALFGPTDPARTGPQVFAGSRVRVLRDASSRVDHRRHTEAEAGLRRIGVDAVFAAAMKAIALGKVE
jgi:heptosyltransferase-1